MRRLAPIAILTALVLVGCGSSSGTGGGGMAFHRKAKLDPQCGRADYEGSQRCMVEIGLYCGYGAVSRAQLDECNKNVTWGQIKRLDTNAAVFARDIGGGKCLYDAGPFCVSTLRQFTAQTEANYYGSQ